MSDENERETQRELEQIVDQLKQFRGTGTQLVSLYIPENKQLSDVVSHIRDEYGEAKNIKQKSTRKNVQAALSSIKSQLRYYDSVPENGMAAFSGVVDDNTGQQETFIIDNLPIPITTYKYHCDSEFFVEPLEDSLNTGDVYGLLVLDRRTAQLGKLQGNRIVHIDTLESNIMGKHKAGGQCLPPETPVRTSGEGTKPIKQVSEGDTILGYQNNELVNTTIRNKWSSKKPTYTISTDSGQIEVSGDHTVFCKDAGEIIQKQAESITVKDKLLQLRGTDLVPAEVVSIDKNPTEKKLIDIETDTHNFFAHGFLVHNSAQRFDRLIEEALQNFFDDIADRVNSAFVSERHELNGFFVGGPSPTKEQFLKTDGLHHELEVTGVYDIDDTTERGLEQLVNNAEEQIEDSELFEQRELMDAFFEQLRGEKHKSAYGDNEVLWALKVGAVDTVLLSENRRDETASEVVCEENSHKNIKFGEEEMSVCPECGSSDVVIKNQSTADLLKDLAAERGSEVRYISDSFERGEQLKSAFGGLGALLRFEPQ